MEKTLIYKGITCMFSAVTVQTLDGDEALFHMLDAFFENEKVEDIKWVMREDFRSDDGVLPMYTMSNGNITVLFWPVQSGDNRLMGIELLSERQELVPELDL